MGFFTDEELLQLKIKKMILHVVGDGDFEAQPELPANQQGDFFLARISEINASGLFRFEAGSATKATLEAMATGKQSFEKGGQPWQKPSLNRMWEPAKMEPFSYSS